MKLIEQILAKNNVREALNRVVSNKGASGIDGMKVEELRDYMNANWTSIKQSILERRYKPAPVRRVEIPKPNGGVRKLGIPTVVDRTLQQSIVQVLTPIFEAEFVMLTPKSLKEAAYSLGATRTEVIGSVILPNARSGIVAAYILALGRALGETMAVTMLIGNTDKIPTSLFDTGQSMASLIANQFNEAHGLKLSSLIAIALVLFLITAIINGIVKIILNKKRA